MIFLTLSLLTALLLAVTLLPLSRHEAWWIRDWDFPRLQLSVAAVMLLAAQLMLLDLSQPWSQVLVATALLCGAYHAWWIAPYTKLLRPQVVSADLPDANDRDRDKGDSTRRIRVMTANVLATNHRADALLALVHAHRPDVLVTLESDHWWQRQLDGLQPEYPYSIKCPLDNLYGMHVYSRLPLKNAAIQYLVEPDVPSMHATVVMRCGREVSMHFLHPAPPSPTENEGSSERDVELLVVAKSVAGLDCPVIVTGDLNDVAWSSTTRLFLKISGLLDPRIGRVMCNTYHANHWFMRWPLDHLFHSRHFTLSFIRRLPAFGSDHFPVVIELMLDDAAFHQQRGLEADADDHTEADEKIDEQDVSEADVHEPGK